MKSNFSDKQVIRDIAEFFLLGLLFSFLLSLQKR